VTKYRVELKPVALKELDKLPDSLVARVYPRLEELAKNPRPAGCKKLKGGDHEWRIRIGDYRVVYVIDDKHRLISVTRIRHRREVY
jgi:mRNA interferase RelE/StbE